MNNDLEKQIETVLFWKGEPMSFKRLADTLKVTKEEIQNALINLKTNLLHDLTILQLDHHIIAIKS